MSHAGVPLKTYRPMPVDFPETFERVGWEGIEAECRAHKTTIKRWMLSFGEEELQRRRRAWLEARYGERGHRIGGVRPGLKTKAARYVAGRTRSAVNPYPSEE